MTSTWQTIYFVTTTRRRFRVIIGGEVVFEGVAVPSPDGVARVDITDIVADHIKPASVALPTPLPVASWTSADLTFPLTLSAEVMVVDADTDEQLLSERVAYNYTYGRSTPTISDAIIKGAPIIRTFRSHTAPVSVVLTMEGGDTITLTANAEGAEDFSVIIPTEPFPTLTGVSIDGVVVPVESCHDWAVYYTNALGEINCLPLASVRESADVERWEYSSPYIREDVRSLASGRHNYRNTITRSYECGSGWIDESRLAGVVELTESRLVWLWNTQRGFIPVVLTNTQSDQPTMRGNGYKPFRLTMTAKEARTERR
jgi:hypothetical protein